MSREDWFAEITRAEEERDIWRDRARAAEREVDRLRPLVEAAVAYSRSYDKGPTAIGEACTRLFAAAHALSSPTPAAPAVEVLDAEQVRAALLRGVDDGRERRAVVTWIKDLARQWHERYVRDAEPKAKQIREAFDDLAGTIERGNHRDPTFTWHMAKDGPLAPAAGVPLEHEDYDHRGTTCCKRCGAVKPRDGWISKCKGFVRIALREEP